MKKFLKFGAVLTALVLGLVCFAACGEEEESRSVVAEYVSEDLLPFSYIFYSDGTYEYKQFGLVAKKGKYTGSSPTTIGRMTMIQEQTFDSYSEQYIPEPKNFVVAISKSNGDLQLKEIYDDEDNDENSNIFLLKD